MPFRRVGATALLVVLVVLPFAVAQPVSGPTLQARVDGGWVVVEADAAGAEGLHVVVTHEDPLAGQVVDRVLPLDLAEDGTLRALVPDARFGVDLTLRLVDPPGDLPSMPDVPGLLDGLAVSELPTLARVELPGIPAVARSSTTRVPVYVQGRDIYQTQEPRLLVSPNGIVSLLWVEGSSLFLSSSTDGGRAFSEPFAVAHALESEAADPVMWYTAAAGPAGEVVVLQQTRRLWNGTIEGSPWRIVRVDPAGPRLLSDASLGGPGVRARLAHEELLLTRGSMLLAFTGDLQPSNTTWSPAGAFTSEVRVVEVEASGAVTPRGVVDAAAVGRSGHIAASPSGERLAYVWTASTSPPGAPHAYISRSEDGGRTFGPAAELRGIAPADETWEIEARSIAIDDAGVVHLALIGHEHLPEGVAVWFDGWYVRIPPVGPLTAHALLPQIPEEHLGGGRASILWPQLALRETRLTLILHGSTAVYLGESLDGGISWGPLVRLEGQHGRHQIHLAPTPTLGILPDGRPVFAGLAGDARHPPDFATVLPFDPEPTSSTGLVRLLGVLETIGAPSITLEGDDAANVPAGGHASVYLQAHNLGAHEARGDPVVRGLPENVGFVAGRLVLAANETLGYGLLFQDLGGAAPASVEVTLVLRDDGRDVSAPFKVRLGVAGSPPPAAPREEPTPSPAPVLRLPTGPVRPVVTPAATPAVTPAPSSSTPPTARQAPTPPVEVPPAPTPSGPADDGAGSSASNDETAPTRPAPGLGPIGVALAGIAALAVRRR